MGARGLGVGGVVEVAQVGTAGVVLGDAGRVEGDGIADVRVLVVVVAGVLPGAGHGHLGEVEGGRTHGGGGRGVGLPEGDGEVVDRGEVGEAPGSREQVEAVGVLALPGAGVRWGGGGDVVGAGREGVLMEDAEVLVVPGDDHRLRSPATDGVRPGRVDAAPWDLVDVDVIIEAVRATDKVLTGPSSSSRDLWLHTVATSPRSDGERVLFAPDSLAPWPVSAGAQGRRRSATWPDWPASPRRPRPGSPWGPPMSARPPASACCGR